jgi:hypothetical protein
MIVTILHTPGRELNNTEAAPCRDELYLALCTHDIVRELGLDHQKINAEGESTQDTMSLYDYNLSPGDEALHAARLWDAPFTDHLRKRRDAIRGEGDSTAASEDEDGASVWREGNGHGVGACQLHLSFVVMVHKPQLGKITRLVKRLARHPCHTTFLHVDAHLSHDRYSLLAALASAYSNVRLTRQRMHGQWGGISLVRIGNVNNTLNSSHTTALRTTHRAVGHNGSSHGQPWHRLCYQLKR